jgi:hypothetical protein
MTHNQSPKQLIAQTIFPIAASPGQPEKHDYENPSLAYLWWHKTGFSASII